MRMCVQQPDLGPPKGLSGQALKNLGAGGSACGAHAGVYANGGPSTVDKRLTMESLTDRDNTPTPPGKQRLVM